jgi:predicted transcriptional regulator of viral defense system
MKLIDAYQKIAELNVSVFQTRDVSAYLNISVSHASKILERLALSSQVVHLAHGRWGLRDRIDILQLPELLTMPYPSYISLQTALYYQGMISQVPTVIYAVSLATSRCFNTPLGTVSIHHMQPDLFCGYKTDDNNIKMATPEKALVDLLYLSPAKTRLFASLPELELGEDFNRTLAEEYISMIPSQRRRTLVATLFTKLS